MARRWVILNTITIIIIAGGVIMLYIWATQPAVSRPSNINGPDVMGVSTPSNARDKVFATKFFTMKISDTYVVRDHGDYAGAGILDRHLLVSPVDAGSGQVAITVATMPQEGIRAISDVTFRQQNEQVYEAFSWDGLPKGAVAFLSRQNGYEISVFMPQANKYAAVVISGRPDREALLRDEIEAIISSWQWL